MSLTWTSLPDLSPLNISTPVDGEVEGPPVVSSGGQGGGGSVPVVIFAFTDAPQRTSAPFSGAYTSTIITQTSSWEIAARMKRISDTGQRLRDGSLYIGLTRNLVSDINQWDFCFNVSTEPREIRDFPHPSDSVLIFEGVDNAFPPLPTSWKHGIWKSNDQLIRIECINQTVRYYVDDLLVYTSIKRPDYSSDVYVAILFDSQGQSITELNIRSDASVLLNESLTQGPATSADCEGLFPVPTSVTVPVGVSRVAAAVSQMPPLPQGPTDPIPVQFRELIIDWGEFQQQFGTGVKEANTLHQTPVRRFEIEWDGLSPEQAGILDAHYERTHSGIPFSIRHVHTGEIVNNCRYASYVRGDQVRYWVQSRSAVIVRYV